MNLKQSLWIIQYVAVCMVAANDPSVPSPGSEGAPCGSTPYRDYGKCNAGLTCQRKSIFTSFAPGTCKDEQVSFGGPDGEWFVVKWIAFGLCVSLLLNGFYEIWCCRDRRKCISKNTIKFQKINNLNVKTNAENMNLCPSKDWFFCVLFKFRPGLVSKIAYEFASHLMSCFNSVLAVYNLIIFARTNG